MLLLDSNIIIYATQPGFDDLRDLIRNNNSVTSIISKVETLGYHRLAEDDQRFIIKLFNEINLVGLTETIADIAIRLRQEKSLSLGDALIAATALALDLTLVTRNETDFRHIKGLKLINPFSEE